MKKIVISVLLIAAVNIGMAQNQVTDQTTFSVSTPLVTKSSESESLTSGEVLKKRSRKPRIDREINKNKFVFKGEWMMGLTASYGTLTTEDTNIGLIFDDLKLNGTIVSVKPFFGYFFSDNHCIGLRLGYSHASGGLGNAALNLGEANDIDLSIGNMEYKNNSYAFGLYLRSYLALDRRGRFGLFSEWELSGSVGRSEFAYMSGEVWNRGISDVYKCKLSFNPGVAIYIFPNVCASVSFGLGGLQYTHTRQMDGEGNYTGKRNFSKLRFRLNIADINVGMTIHLWNKKKD